MEADLEEGIIRWLKNNQEGKSSHDKWERGLKTLRMRHKQNFKFETRKRCLNYCHICIIKCLRKFTLLNVGVWREENNEVLKGLIKWATIPNNRQKREGEGEWGKRKLHKENKGDWDKATWQVRRFIKVRRKKEVNFEWICEMGFVNKI